MPHIPCLAGALVASRLTNQKRWPGRRLVLLVALRERSPILLLSAPEKPWQPIAMKFSVAEWANNPATNCRLGDRPVRFCLCYEMIIFFCLRLASAPTRHPPWHGCFSISISAALFLKSNPPPKKIHKNTPNAVFLQSSVTTNKNEQNYYKSWTTKPKTLHLRALLPNAKFLP